VATESLIIIGSGPAGLTAAVYAGRANLHPLLIEGASPGGQLMGTTAVENWPGQTSIMGPQLMMQMKEHAAHFGTRFLSQEVVSCDFSQKPFTLTTSKGTTLQTNAVIVASGAAPKKLGCPGEEEYWGKGVTTCAVCDGALYADKPVVVIGGGDTAMEDASFLTKFTKDITVVQRGDKLTACHAMQERVINHPSIKLIFNSTVSAITGDGSHVQGLALTNTQTTEKTKLPAQGVFIAIGLKPRTDFLNGQLELAQGGFIKLHPGPGLTATSVEGVFAAGDVADMQYRQAITAAGSGCMAALDVERYLGK
jgi:thioredoxin reductase (NADPH)